MRFCGDPDQGMFAGESNVVFVTTAVCHTAPPAHFTDHDRLTGVQVGGRYRLEVMLNFTTKKGRPYETLRLTVGPHRYILGWEHFRPLFRDDPPYTRHPAAESIKKWRQWHKSQVRKKGRPEADEPAEFVMPVDE